MPVYEYRCEPCDHTFEKYVRTFNEAVVCPTCARASVDKLLSTFAMGGVARRSAPAIGGGGCCGRGGCGCGP